MIYRILLLAGLLFTGLSSFAQNPERFKDEIGKFSKEETASDTKNLNLFTGSSSIRVWNDIGERFPEHNILNRGFGGSHMSDLLYYADELIFKYQPDQIFIYEGDNDIAAGKAPEAILATADSLLQKIRSQLPRRVKVYFISAKPSVARWNLRDQYITFNKQLKAWTEEQKNVGYIDVWNPMMAADGEVMKDIFVKDNLHMNSKGYDIWARVMAGYLSK